METPATTFSPVSKFHFGAAVRDAEGASGALAHVVVAPESHALIAVGVSFGFGPFGHEFYAPVERVVAASDAGIELSATRAEMEKAGKQPAGVRLGGETTISQNGRRLGKLEQVSFNAESHTLRHLIVERGMGGNVIVPANALQQVSASGVSITSAHLTGFRPDSELRERVLSAIQSYARLRVDLAGIDVTAIDGVVWLRGYVSSEMNRRLVGDLVGGVEGIGELHNELITDPELAAVISSALARDPRTAEERIGVYPILGTVRLRGAVRTATAREAAEQLVSAVHGVGGLVNELRVNPNANVLPVMASVTNDEDAVPGGR